MAWKIEPFHTWYYLFTWYPFLLIVNHGTALRSPEHSLFRGRWRTALALLAWSVPAWLLFEIWNFRLEDWYYVGVPRGFWARRVGVALSFATVLPGIFFLEEFLRVRGAFERIQGPRFRVRGSLEKGLTIAGGLISGLVLAAPTVFFPLLWGIPILLLDPWLHRGGGPSLLGDLAGGRPGRILRLLAAGLACGLFWVDPGASARAARADAGLGEVRQ
jgi:hypothetical protein